MYYFALIINCVIVLALLGCEHYSSKLKLSGYIEFVQNSRIKRIDLNTGSVSEIGVSDSDSLVQSFDLTPDGNTRVIAIERSRDIPEQLYIISDHNELPPITKLKFIRFPAISPDGKLVAFLSDLADSERHSWLPDWGLYVVNANKVSEKPITDIICSAGKPAWLVDNERVVFGSKDLKIYTMNIRTGLTKLLIDFGTHPAVSHDGRFIAYLANDVDEETRREIVKFTSVTTADYQAIQEKRTLQFKDIARIERSFIEHSIFIYDLKTGQTRKLTGALFVEQPVIWSPDDRYLLYNDRSDVANRIFVVDTSSGTINKISHETGRIMVWNK